jgi:hypothetical protein
MAHSEIDTDFSLDDNRTDELGLEALLSRGRTHDFEKLPQVLWATTGLRIPNPECFERLRRARNEIQHFCAPDIRDLSALSLEFIYTTIDPLIAERFGLFAIEYHEDPNSRPPRFRVVATAPLASKRSRARLGPQRTSCGHLDAKGAPVVDVGFVPESRHSAA